MAGYGTYLDLIRPLIEGKEVIESGMTQEVRRVNAAVAAARGGSPCALVSSGDPGIYAMAGLVFEICREGAIPIVPPGAVVPGGGLRIEVVPGIPALCAGAALLGSPLTHDFCTVSLSDLLTPWETIAARLEAAARADFVIVIYNPKSRRRRDHLRRAQEIILAHRSGETPVGVVRAAMREAQSVTLVPLSELHRAEVDMRTTVFIGNRTTVTYGNYMITPRGYSAKYDLDGPAAEEGAVNGRGIASGGRMSGGTETETE